MSEQQCFCPACTGACSCKLRILQYQHNAVIRQNKELQTEIRSLKQYLDKIKENEHCCVSSDGTCAPMRAAMVALNNWDSAAAKKKAGW